MARAESRAIVSCCADVLSVESPPMINFIGALDTEEARNGIFIKTSQGMRSIVPKIVQITSSSLMEEKLDLIYRCNIGVAKKVSYEVKDIDTDCFQGK